MAKPIFLDPTGRRGRWTGRSLAALVLLVLTATAVLAFTIIEVPIPAPLPLRMEQARLHGLVDRIAGAGRRGAEAGLRPALASALAARGADRAPGGQRLLRALGRGQRAPRCAAHVNELDWVIPAAAFVTGPQHQFDVAARSAIRRDHRRRPAPAAGPADGPECQRTTIGTGPASPPCCTIPRAQRAPARPGRADGGGAPRRRRRLRLRGDAGSPPSAIICASWPTANRRFDARGWTVSMAAPVGDPDWNLAAYARVADKVFLMLYDEHWASGDAGPDRVAGLVRPAAARGGARGRRATRRSRRSPITATTGTPGQPPTALTVEEAWLTAHDSEADAALRSGQRQCHLRL